MNKKSQYYPFCLSVLKIPVLLIALQLCNAQAQGQLLDKTLKTYNQKIFDFLKSVNEIDSSKAIEEYQNSIYSRELFNGGKVKFFEIGITISHSKKYFSVVHNKSISFYKTIDFSTDFPEISKQLKRIDKRECKAEQIIKLLEEINDMYRYNLNPPWFKN